MNEGRRFGFIHKMNEVVGILMSRHFCFYPSLFGTWEKDIFAGQEFVT